MHEGNFTKEIVGVILDELKKYPDAKPKAIKVLVGEILHLVPASVQMHYQFLTQGTDLEGVVLELTQTPVVVRCSQCRSEGTVEDHHLLFCSYCHSSDVEIISGNDVRIESIEAEIESN